MTVYEIHLGRTGKDSQVIADGVDISRTLTGFEVRCMFNERTKVVLHQTAVEVTGSVDVDE